MHILYIIDDNILLVGDIVRLFAVLLLLFKILKTRNCAGISGKTQILIALLCTFPCLDIFAVLNFSETYDLIFKFLFILISYVTVFCIYYVYKETLNHEYDTFRIEFLIVPAALLAHWANHGYTRWDIFGAFSIYLETVAMIPQFIFILKAQEIDTKVLIYICLMGSYKFIFHGIHFSMRYRYRVETIEANCAIVQFIIYCIFFIVGLHIIIKRKRTTYQKNLEAILNFSFVIDDESLVKEKQSNNDQDFQQILTSKVVYQNDIPKVHASK